MSKVSFDEIVLRVRRNGKCGRCGKRTRRTRKFWQTMNPFNRNADGLPKTRIEILKELDAAVKVAAHEVLLCSECEHGLVTKWCKAAPLLHDLVCDDGEKAARAMTELTGSERSGEVPICDVKGDRGPR